MMGGRIWVESEPGAGATFYFTSKMGLSAEKQAQNSIPRDHRNMRILLAEDNSVNQRLATRVLEREGHQVQVAASGREAIALLEHDEFDLVLMDIQMPDLDGLQTTARIREMERSSGKRLPIVAMTAQIGDSDRQRCLKAGMDAYVSKPIRIADLMNLIESVVPGGCFMETKTDPKSVIQEQLAHLDEELALTRVGGDFELLREVVGLFLDDYPRALEKIRSAVAANDPSGVEHNAHSLKGSVSTFGATDVFESALALEKQGRSGNLAGAVDSLKGLEAALQALRPDLEALQARY
jgi:CheY-like chemotaxis protein